MASEDADELARSTEKAQGLRAHAEQDACETGRLQVLLERAYRLAVGHGPDFDVFASWEEALDAYEDDRPTRTPQGGSGADAGYLWRLVQAGDTLADAMRRGNDSGWDDAIDAWENQAREAAQLAGQAGQQPAAHPAGPKRGDQDLLDLRQRYSALFDVTRRLAGLALFAPCTCPDGQEAPGNTTGGVAKRCTLCNTYAAWETLLNSGDETGS